MSAELDLEFEREAALASANLHARNKLKWQRFFERPSDADLFKRKGPDPGRKQHAPVVTEAHYVPRPDDFKNRDTLGCHKMRKR
jgi:hypothetical protein